MTLEVGDVGADRDVAAVLGAALADLEPAPVGELDLERAGRAALRAGDASAHRGEGALSHDLVVTAARYGVLASERVQVAEFRVAQHQPVAGVPQHEGLGDRFHRVAQAHVGGGGELGEAALLGDVHGDADEVAAAVGRILHDLGAGAQPDPLARRVADAELVIDGGVARREVAGEAVEIAVLGMQQGVHVAEGEKVLLRGVAEQGVHRIGPEDRAAGDVPVPEAAAPAAQGRVEALLDQFADLVRRLRPLRLEDVGRGHPRQHEADGGEGDRVVTEGPPPVGDERLELLDDRHLARAVGQAARDDDGLPPRLQIHPHRAGALAEHDDRFPFGEIAREGAGRAGLGIGGADPAGRPDHENLATGRQEVNRKHALEPRLARSGLVRQRQGCQSGERLDLACRHVHRLLVAAPHLQDRHAEEREHEDNEQGR
ncbi:hypothetical protein CHKEEEPN_0444 [Methylorubrum podarium]|nr:hypothetical protein CHKEEEPN_0444 [Methylorubrum podarium]